jgi:hypothetical protein
VKSFLLQGLGRRWLKTRVVEVAELSSILTLAIRNNETGQLKEEADRVRAELL